MELLKLENVTFSYNKDRVILDNINILAGPGENIGLIGANGAGKTTLLKLLVGLLYGYGGRISVSGIEVIGKNYAEIRKRIGYVFQDSDSQLFMTTVYEDIAFGPRNYGLSETEVKRSVSKAMELTGCSHLKDRQIHKLSGGEKKIAAIATVLAMDPQIIIMDEPSNSLDPKNRRNLINVLNSLGCTKLIASHDLDMIWDTCERVILLSNGKILADGPAKEVLSDERLLTGNSLELPLSAKLAKFL
ncbi:MAG: ABC transporter ATP-binding protein [Eubacteriales bacterium]|nr:ABC transporter ATP-binding protein [Eubacteriales bacterium]